MPRLVEIRKSDTHAGLLSTADDKLIELLIALLAVHGEYHIRIIQKAERPAENIPFLQQFLKPDPKQ